MVSNSGAWKTADFEEINNFRRNEFHDHTSTGSHHYLLPRKHTYSATLGIRCVMTVGRLIHSFNKPWWGTHWNKHIRSLIWFMSLAASPTTVPCTPGPLMLDCSPPHTPRVYPSIILPLPTLVSFSAWWYPFVLQSPVYLLFSLPHDPSPPHQPVLRAHYRHGIYHTLLPGFVCVSFLKGFVSFKCKVHVSFFNWGMTYI